MKNPLREFLILAAVVLVGHIVAWEIVRVPKQIELAALFSLLIFYPVIRSPLFGVYLFFIVCPFLTYIRRLYYLVYERPRMDPLLIIGEMIILLILIGLYFEFRSGKGRDRSTVPYSRLVFIYFLFLLARVFVFQSLPLTDALAQFKFYGPAVILFFIGMFFAPRFSHIKMLWVITIVLSTITAVYGLKQLYFGYSQAEQLWFSSIDFSTLAIKGIVRPFSFFQAPVAMADYLQIGIIGCLMLWMWEKKLPFLLLMPTIAVCSWGILMTSVRSSWIGLFATPVLLFLFVNIRGWRRRSAILAVILVGYIGFELVSQTFGAGDNTPSKNKTVAAVKDTYVDLLVNDRATAITNPFEEHSFLSRIRTWNVILACSLEPEMAIMGRGLGSFRADSLYFTYLAELGYPGLIFILIILALFVRRGLQIIDTSPDSRVVVLAKGITVMNLVLILTSITGSHIHNFPGDAYFWFFNGVLIHCRSIEKESPIES